MYKPVHASHHVPVASSRPETCAWASVLCTRQQKHAHGKARTASTLPLPERLRFRLPVLRCSQHVRHSRRQSQQSGTRDVDVRLLHRTLAASVSIAWLSSISSALGDGAGPLPGNSLSRAFSSSFCRCRARSTACSKPNLLNVHGTAV
jgi:hypothetical protein